MHLNKLERNICKWVLVFVVSFAMPTNIVRADSDVNVLQAYTTEQTMTIRQVDISSGACNMSIDVKFPIFNTPAKTTPAPTQAETGDVVSSLETAQLTATIEPIVPSLPVETNASNSVATMFGDYTIVIFIGAGVALIIIVAVVVAIAVTRGKKKKNALRPESGVPSGYGSYIANEKTKFISDVSPADSQCAIKISHSIDPSKTWTLAITGDLIICRAEHCQIRLDDKSVSREHCKITIQGIGLAVAHLGSTNKTTLNGSNVAHNSPLQSGDTIKIGREVLRIDYIQALGSQPPKAEMSRSSNTGNTESIF